MKVSTALSASRAVIEAIRSQPFTRIHGKPTRKARNRLYEEACELANQFDVPYEWAGDHGLLAEVTGAAEYLRLTGEVYVEPVMVEAFNPAITNATSDYQTKKKMAEYDELREAWYVRKGFIQGIGDNIRDALDENYYKQLREKIIGYKGVTIVEYFEHLDAKWCKIDTNTIKQMKKEYYEPWDPIDHITEFSKRLNDEQEELATNSISISEEDKLQFFIEQMYESKQFDREQYVAWEKKPDADKTWLNATLYFEDITADNEAYESNVGGTAKRGRFESAANVAEEKDDQLRLYFDSLGEAATADKEHIQQMSTTNSSMVSLTTAQQKQLAIKDAQISALIDQVKALTTTNQTMAAQLAGGKRGGGGGGGGSGSGGGDKTKAGNKKGAGVNDEKPRPTWLAKLCNTGGYCHSCGFEPIGKGHTSMTCKNKKEGHVDAATKGNRQGGSVAHKPADFTL